MGIGGKEQGSDNSLRAKTRGADWQKVTGARLEEAEKTRKALEGPCLESVEFTIRA